MRRTVMGTRMRRWLPVLPPFAAGLLGSNAYASLNSCSVWWGPVLGGLYYVPIVVAAITVGARAGLGVAIGAGTAHTVAVAVVRGDQWLNPIAQTVLFICVALTAARLAKFRSEAVRAIAPTEEPATASDARPDKVQSGFGAWQSSRVVAGLVRHCRTPVTSIEGAGWVLEDRQLPDGERRELVAIVRKEAQRLNRVLSDVIDFTEPRRPTFRRVDIAALLDGVIQRARAKGDGHVFSADIPPDLPAVRGDSEQLRNALLNLVMNSVQASPGGGQITITARVENDEFAITIEDNGRGIPPDAVDKIFDPFFTTHEHSLGLGLPVALRIVTEHGGRIALDCHRSEGVSFSVILPVHRAAPLQ